VIPDPYTLEKIAFKYNLPANYFFLSNNESQDESAEINEDLFNEVFALAYNLASEKGLEINGTYFLGCYSLVQEELQKNSQQKVTELFKNITPYILKLVKKR
jgi:hypothetical protein